MARIGVFNKQTGIIYKILSGHDASALAGANEMDSTIYTSRDLSPTNYYTFNQMPTLSDLDAELARPKP